MGSLLVNLWKVCQYEIEFQPALKDTDFLIFLLKKNKESVDVQKDHSNLSKWDIMPVKQKKLRQETAWDPELSKV